MTFPVRVSGNIWYNCIMPREIALYIHVPFCRRKCPYCSFVSLDDHEADTSQYVAALGRELTSRAAGESIRSVFLGGGTPSLLSVEQIGGLLSAARPFTIKDAEITIEANPGTVDREYLTAIRELGVNRMSLGVQSLDDGELALLGRVHTAAEAADAVQYARAAGFDNLNIDLIYGLPGQTRPDWQRNLDAVLSMKPEHLSLYALTLEVETPMGRAVELGDLPEPDPDACADQYEMAEDMLAARGYRHYEISNWALAGRECRHNLAYWKNLPYVGVGVAAHSCLDGRRFANTESLDRYLAESSGSSSPLPELDEVISPELELAETVILGLRLCQGIDRDDIRRRFGVDILVRYRRQVEEMAEAGLLERTGGHVRLTRRGRLLSNEVFWRFLPSEADEQTPPPLAVADLAPKGS